MGGRSSPTGPSKPSRSRPPTPTADGWSARSARRGLAIRIARSCREAVLRLPVLPGERQEPRPALERRGDERERQPRELGWRGTADPLRDPRPEPRQDRDARAAAAGGIRDAVRPPDVRHPVERERDLAAPRVLDPGVGE